MFSLCDKNVHLISLVMPIVRNIRGYQWIANF